MPVTSFSMDNVKNAGPTFPKVKLTKNETWRIVCIEAGPTFEYSHRLQKPKLSPVTGEVQMVTKTKRDNTEYEDYDYDFVGTPICLGDPDILEEKGVDVDHCPVCALSVSQPDQFDAPQRRFAIHVLKYQTRAGGQVAEPFSVETRVWVLSEGKFAKVAQIIGEWGGDARKVDLVLGPCTNEGFQNYEIAAGSKCEMLQSEDRVKRAVETYENNHAEDLGAFCGRKVKDRKYLQNDIEDIQARWNVVKAGGQQVSTPDVSTTTLDTSLLDTIGAAPAKPAAAPPAAAPPAAEHPPASTPAADPQTAPGGGPAVVFEDPPAPQGATAPGAVAPPATAPAPETPATGGGLDEFMADTTSNSDPDVPDTPDPAAVASAPPAASSGGADESFESLIASLSK